MNTTDISKKFLLISQALTQLVMFNSKAFPEEVKKDPKTWREYLIKKNEEKMDPHELKLYEDTVFMIAAALAALETFDAADLKEKLKSVLTGCLYTPVAVAAEKMFTDPEFTARLKETGLDHLLEQKLESLQDYREYGTEPFTPGSETAEQ